VLWVRDRLCDHLIELDKRGPCPSAPIPVELQIEIRGLVGSHVHFVAEPPQASLEHPVVVLGAVRRTGDRAELAVDTQCGPLCGRGDTLILRRTASGWHTVGHTGLSWIS
jgi:hypothetical protein